MLKAGEIPDHLKACPKLCNTFRFKSLFPIYAIDKLEAAIFRVESLPMLVCHHLLKILMQMSLLFVRCGKNVLFHY